MSAVFEGGTAAWMSLAPLAPLGLLTLLTLLAHLCAGLGVGLLYFRGLRHGVHLLATGSSIRNVVALTLVRFLGLGMVLFAVARWEGALPLLAASMGIVLARFVALRGERAGARAPTAGPAS